MNYDQLIILSSEDVVKRINKEVNEVNGHLWDKIVLRDGTVGYVFSDNLEITEDYANISFEYNDKNYNIYFSPTKYGKNIEDYPYYLVAKEYKTNDVLICYSSTRISLSDTNVICDEITKNDNGFIIKLKNDRNITTRKLEC